MEYQFQNLSLQTLKYYFHQFVHQDHPKPIADL